MMAKTPQSSKKKSRDGKTCDGEHKNKSVRKHGATVVQQQQSRKCGDDEVAKGLRREDARC